MYYVKWVYEYDMYTWIVRDVMCKMSIWIILDKLPQQQHNIKTLYSSEQPPV